MEKGIKSKRKILDVAFNLFAAYSYPDVSYSLLEKATGISRGSMVYYFKNKEGIFRAVIEKYILDMTSNEETTDEDKASLKSFCDKVVANIAKAKETARKRGIANFSGACLNISRNALQFIPEFRENRLSAQNEEIEMWKGVIENAKQSGEIKADIDAGSLALLFQSVKWGQTLMGVYVPIGVDPETQRHLFDSLYALVKN